MKKNNGQTLIEVLVALGTAVVIISAITVAVLSALSNSEFENNQSLATDYSQQGMEIVRSMRNNNYGDFKKLSGTYCLAKSCTSLSDSQGASCGPKGVSCGQNVDLFVREVAIDTSENNNCVVNGTHFTQATTTVYWADSKCTSRTNLFCHKVAITGCLSDAGVVLRTII